MILGILIFSLYIVVLCAQVDEFQVHCRDVGQVRSIILESNGLSDKPNWHLDMVVIEVGVLK
jgi:hypothetical protein